MKFLKENKLAVLSIAAFVIVAILLAIPGQYAHFGIVGNDFTHKLSGGQFFFNTYENVLGNKIGSVVGEGVAIIVLAPISIALICLGRKSSFFVLLSSIVNVVIASLFFGMENFARHAYPFQVFEGKYFISWPNYICAALIIILAIYIGYKAIMMMKDEIKHPAKASGPSYNYLKK